MEYYKVLPAKKYWRALATVPRKLRQRYSSADNSFEGKILIFLAQKPPTLPVSIYLKNSHKNHISSTEHELQKWQEKERVFMFLF